MLFYIEKVLLPPTPYIESYPPDPAPCPIKGIRKCPYNNVSKLAFVDKVFCKTQGAVQVASGLDL